MVSMGIPKCEFGCSIRCNDVMSDEDDQGRTYYTSNNIFCISLPTILLEDCLRRAISVTDPVVASKTKDAPRAVSTGFNCPSWQNYLIQCLALRHLVVQTIRQSYRSHHSLLPRSMPSQSNNTLEKRIFHQPLLPLDKLLHPPNLLLFP